MIVWNDFFNNVDIKNNLKDIYKFIEEEEQKYTPLKVFPKKENLFKCFELTPFEKMRVVLIGMDPYINEINGECQAQGLCFSVPDNFPYPPSLKNVFKELVSDIECEYPINGNLNKWGEQGVLLLNRSLSVLQGKSNSHKKIWTNFNLKLMEFIINNKDFCIFICWGNEAKKFLNIFDMQKNKNHIVLEATHPSPLSANRGGFFGCKHFSKTNQLLKKHSYEEIDWSLN